MPDQSKQSMNKPLPVTDNFDGKPPKPIYQHILNILTIVVFYLPLVFLLIHLRGVYPQGTSVLDLSALHMILVIGLFITPLILLYMLGINWHAGDSDPDL
ncbi:MAG: hypothetical protein QNJ69_02105 [Gammaproteobacteria bacterium]|nr:hypothetical protein [Gammaproteobacteria bacterium]